MNTKQRHHESYICLSCRIVFRQLCEGNAENIETQWRAIKSSDVIHRTYTPWNEFCSPPENLGRAYFKDGQIISKHPFSGAKMLVSGISNKNTKKHQKVSRFGKNLGRFPAQGPKGSRRKTLHVWPPPTAKIQILSIFQSKDETCGCFRKIVVPPNHPF